jgi:hypothetical protein
MNDEKFEEIMKEWASHEIESAPQLRPTKEMYQMVKAKKRKVLFPVFARWATVGIAAVTLIVVGILHPDVFRPSTYFEQPPGKQELSGEPPQEEVAQERVPASTTEKSDDLALFRTTLDESAMRSGKETEKRSSVSKEGESMTVEQPALMSESTSDSPVGQTVQQPVAAPRIAKSRTISKAPKSKAASPQPSLPSDAEEKFDSGISYQNGQFAAPEPPMSDKDTVGEKHVGSKTFRLKNGVWADSNHSQKKEIIKIKRNSQAYHNLITAIPDLEVYFEIGQNVVVNIGEYSIEIADEGKTELTEDDLKTLVKE